MISLFIVAAIALSVAIGYKTKYNTGFFAIVFAYVIGCFVMMMKPKEVISSLCGKCRNCHAGSGVFYCDGIHGADYTSHL